MDMSSRLLHFNKSCYCAIICRCIAVCYTGFRSNTMQSAEPLFQFLDVHLSHSDVVLQV